MIGTNGGHGHTKGESPPPPPPEEAALVLKEGLATKAPAAAEATSTVNIQGAPGAVAANPSPWGVKGANGEASANKSRRGYKRQHLMKRGENLRRQLESKARAVCQLPWEDARGGYCRPVSVSRERRRKGAWQRREPVLQWTTRGGAGQCSPGPSWEEEELAT